MNALRRFSGLHILLILIFLLPFLLAFYRPGTQERTHQITFWTTYTDDIGIPAQEAVIAAFEKANPDIQVKMVPIPGGDSDLSSLLTAVRGGTGPDVYFLPRFTTPQYAAMGLLENLGPQMAREKIDLSKEFIPSAWSETQYKGQTYSLPIESDARALYYNKSMLRQAGVDPDVLDPSHGPISIDTLKSIALKVNHTDARGAYDRVGFIPWLNEGWHTTWAIAYGAKFFDANSCQVTPTDPGLEKAYQLFYDWNEVMPQNKLNTFTSSYIQKNGPPSQDPFYTEHLAMTISGDWTLEQIKKYAPKMDYGVTYLPSTYEGEQPYTWSGGYSLTIPTGAKHADDAYRFMRFMTGPEGQRIYVKDTGHLPTWKSLLNEQSLFTPEHNFFVKLLPYSHGRVPIPVSSSYWDELTTAQEKVTLHAATPQQALQTVYQHLQPQMQPYCV
ncbi:ABC transporter substrate-binding protein [Ktedonospora formicarum]|uniref:Sugar ABC transporter substrate-binding protein n=1 Tax=Ktedonospora formicarum TaxID=2778364 RepID=A0A8J3MT59_9CHLR|nr:ABC transporter substrate-binding protein [Ktedonospora formicarum]GHO46825.1 sugar ABC transporter substrate-binding protein [Ktedonospora formicarum]